MNCGQTPAAYKNGVSNGSPDYVWYILFPVLGKGREGFILGACRQGICFVPVILLLPKLCGINVFLAAL